MKIIFSIKSKLILAISALMAVIFLIVASLFINEKKVELATDIYHGVSSFAELTSTKISDLTDLYLKEDGFVYFNREIYKLFEQNSDISYIKVLSYRGEILYDSNLDKDKKYNGEERTESDPIVIDMIKSKNSSFKTGSDVYYVKDGGFVDVSEKSLIGPETGFRISYFVQPAGNKYSVIYGVSYADLESRVADMISRIIYTALFGFLLGIVLSILMSLQVTRPVLKLVDGASEVAKGNLKVRVSIKSRDELGYLGESFNKMTEDLEKSLDARIYKERVGKELELARKIQDEIVPKNLPVVPGYEFAAGLVPASEVGGDMYDFITVNNDVVVGYLGDVTGHGVPASMVGAVANALFYSFADAGGLKDIVSKANKILKKKKTATMFMTLEMFKLNLANGEVAYVNAGHEPILHYSARDGSVAEGSKGGLAVGMIDDISGVVQENKLVMGVGDFIVLFSDGVVEMWKDEKECYGTDRFKALLARCGGMSANAVRDAIFADLKTFAGGFEQKDDVTVVVVKRA